MSKKIIEISEDNIDVNSREDDSEIIINEIQMTKLNLLKDLYEILGFDFGDDDANVDIRNYYLEEEISKELKHTNIKSDHLSYSGNAKSTDIGQYEQPNGYFNINSACNWITAKAYNHYIKKLCGHCAKAVRSAIDVGYGTDPNGARSFTSNNGYSIINGKKQRGRPRSAYQYDSYLPTIGFKCIKTLYTLDEQSDWSSSDAQLGDIAVMAHEEHGHICMWNGNQWVSDFKQNNMWPYQGNGKVNIFRYG